MGALWEMRDSVHSNQNNNNHIILLQGPTSQLLVRVLVGMGVIT